MIEQIEKDSYLVGGAVRDHILSRKVNDRDYVVVGHTTEEMLEAGFTRVGNRFPVFLHPATKDEYALARTERKSGNGYHGFEVQSDKSVTLLDDLKRRDLTMNAIAMRDGKLFDPFNGVNDINLGLLQNVSEAFEEDPTRVLRVARFAAQLNFRVSKSLLTDMQSISLSGELNTIEPDMVWKETNKALLSKNPERFFEVLRDCYALEVIFPELNRLIGVPQPEQYHNGRDAWEHTIETLKYSEKFRSHPNIAQIKWAIMMHDIAKGTTDKTLLPKHYNHESRGIPIVEELCNRVHAPNRYKDLALLATQYHMKCHRVLEMKATTLVRFMYDIGAFKNNSRLIEFIIICRCDALGKGDSNRKYPEGAYLMDAHRIASSLNIQELKEDTKLDGEKLGFEIRKKRVSLMKRFVK